MEFNPWFSATTRSQYKRATESQLGAVFWGLFMKYFYVPLDMLRCRYYIYILLQISK